MVEQQLRYGAVLDTRVLEAIGRIRRENFVPAGYTALSYADIAVPLPCGQHMMPPRTVGLALQALQIQPGEEVLEVGTGSGFVTACMMHLGAQVTSLEIHAELARAARASLEAEQLIPTVFNENVWSYQTTLHYDIIMVNASLPQYDAHFEQWLKPGGRLFLTTGTPPIMEARLTEQLETGLVASRGLFDLTLDPLLKPHDGE